MAPRAINPGHDSVFRQLPQFLQSLLPFPLQPGPRDHCPSSAAGNTRAKASSPSAANTGSDILDRDGKFGEDVTDLLTTCGVKPTRISPASPWQNAVAERWIGSCRRELLDRLIVLNDVHSRRRIREYVAYYHAGRIQDFLEKDTPAARPVSAKPGESARLISLPRIGGLHHRYDWQQVA